MKISFLILAVIISGCCNCSSDKLNISVDIKEFNAWVNLMPGMNPGSFHFTGKAEIKNQQDEIISPSLNKVTITQGKKSIYEIAPFFDPDLKSDNYEIAPNRSKLFTFGSEGQAPIKDELDKEGVITVVLQFIQDTKVYYYTIENVKLDKAY